MSIDLFTPPSVGGAAWETPSLARGSGTLTADGAANTKGLYTELIASTSFECDAVAVLLQKIGATQDLLVDVAIGAAGSEVVKAPNLAISCAASAAQQVMYVLPISITAGSRVSARCQCTTGSGAVGIVVYLMKELFPTALTRVTDYGTATGDSGGTSVDPGAIVSTKGGYSQLSASTTNPIKALLVHFGGQLNAARATCDWLIDIATGVALSEVVQISDLPLSCDANNDGLALQSSPLIAVAIPAGTRLAARAACNITDATDRLIDVCVYGID